LRATHLLASACPENHKGWAASCLQVVIQPQTGAHQQAGEEIEKNPVLAERDPRFAGLGWNAFIGKPLDAPTIPLEAEPLTWLLRPAIVRGRPRSDESWLALFMLVSLPREVERAYCTLAGTGPEDPPPTWESSA